MYLHTTCPLRAIIVFIQNARVCVPRMPMSTARMALFTLTLPSVWDAAIVRGLARTLLRATTLNWVKCQSVISASIILTLDCLRRVWRLVRCECLTLLRWTMDDGRRTMTNRPSSMVNGQNCGKFLRLNIPSLYRILPALNRIWQSSRMWQ